MGSTSQFLPVDCPMCSTPTALPYRVTAATLGTTLVDLRCSSCGTQWEVERPEVAGTGPPSRLAKEELTTREDASLPLQRGDHICSMYSSESELVQIAAEFIADGLRRDQRCWYVTCGGEIDAVRNELSRRQIDVDGETARGALQLMSGSGTYLNNGAFAPDHVIQNFSDAIADSQRDGFAGFRAAADMSWALELEGGPRQVLVYEAMLRVLFATRPATGLCLYDRTRMPTDIIEGVLTSHPVVYSNGAYRQNTCFDAARTDFSSANSPTKR